MQDASRCPQCGGSVQREEEDSFANCPFCGSLLHLDGVVSSDLMLQPVVDQRELPTRLTQRLQVFLQDHVIFRTLKHGDVPTKLPRAARLLNDFPALRRIPARLVGLGFRPEHVRTPDIAI